MQTKPKFAIKLHMPIYQLEVSLHVNPHEKR
jgi:hypothetical protein